MKEIRLGLVGFGNVAQGFVQILRDHEEEYASRYGLRFSIVAIADPIKGNAYRLSGFNPAELLDALNQPGQLNSLPGVPPEWDALEMIRSARVDVIVELSYTNLRTGEPASTYIAEALRHKKHVVTTNKGPVALHFSRLAALAKANGVQLGVEGTVMSGTPALQLGWNLLAAAGIRRVEGILNGTCNYILSKMEAGSSYAEALAEAQELGYAEADPSGDVEGFDTAGKVVILARLLAGAEIAFDEVEREGISNLSQEDISAAQAAGKRWKLIGSLEQRDGCWYAAVQPQCLPVSHPLANVSGASNAIMFDTELLGPVSLIGPGAGRLQTGYAVLQDLLSIYAPHSASPVPQIEQRSGQLLPNTLMSLPLQKAALKRRD